ncbi:MAG: O-antigen ligase family protein [Acidimicrobiales bacterium]|nr:O-antigen ligase family protein [Acidimicrobiales bacterium]
MDPESRTADSPLTVAGSSEESGTTITEPSGDPERLVALVVGACVLMMCVAYLPSVVNLFGTPRKPIGFAVAGCGLVLLVRLVCRRDKAAIAFAALIGWSFLSAVMSSTPLLSLFAGPSLDQGWIYLVVYAGWWAVGRNLRPAARRAVGAALVAGAMANVGLAVVQALSAGGFGILDFTHGRSMGFLGNPVHLGAFLAGSFALIAVVAHRTTRQWWMALPVIAAIGVGLNLSGSRIALVSAFVVPAVPLLLSRRLRSAAILAALVAGLLLGGVLLPGESGSSRVSGGDAAGGLAPRVETWKAGFDAFTERPVLGWGPGRYAEATTSRTTLRQAQTSDPSSIYDNAHNFVVDQLVTTGVIGLGLLGAFTLLAARRARGPYAYFAAAIGLTWLFEPVTMYTAPLLMIAFGLAAPRLEQTEETESISEGTGRTRRLTMLASVGVVVGLIASTPYVVAAFYLQRTTGSKYDDRALDGAKVAGRLFPFDPDTVSAEGTVRTWRALVQPSAANVEAAIEAREHVISLDPTSGISWGQLAFTRSFIGRPDDATTRKVRDEYLEALERIPWSAPALQGLYSAAVKLGDKAEARKWADELCLIDRCPKPASKGASSPGSRPATQVTNTSGADGTVGDGGG